MIALILQEGQPKAGVLEALDLIEAQGLKIGLATSSPFAMVEAVLGKLGIQDRFMAVHSAEVERFGKPHPDVYIHAAEKLGVEPVHCLAIEDSFTGLLAAKAAGLSIMSGYELFFFQGVDAFRLFTGQDVDQAALRLALKQGEGVSV